jgi:hypothetical protein
VTRATTTSALRRRGLLLAVLLAASQVGAWVHAAAVAHVTCLEHGESIHADVLAARDASSTERFAVAPDARVGAAPAARPGHEHCGGGALVRWRDVALAAPVAIARAPLATTAAPPFDRAPAVLRGRDVYLLAPKTSPPPTDA